MRRALHIGLALASFALPIAARGDFKDPLTIIGLARSSCGEYLLAVEGEKKARPPNANPDATYSSHYGGYVDYADGFLTGANFGDTTPRRMIGQGGDRAGRMAWLENYCRTNPLANFGGALIALREYLAEHGG